MKKPFALYCNGLRVSIANWRAVRERGPRGHAAFVFFDFLPIELPAFLPVAGVADKLRFSASIRSITGARLGWVVAETGLPFCFCLINCWIFSR